METRKAFKKQSDKQRRENPKQYKCYSDYIARHPERYSLADKCFYVGKVLWGHGKKLERGHVDYEDKCFNYVTVCRKCNLAMEKDARLMKLAEDYVKILKIGRKQAKWLP